MNQHFKRITALCLFFALVFGMVGGVPFPKAAAAQTDADASTEVANLLTNPGFEELDEKGEPIGWSKWGTAAHSMVDGNTNPDEVYDGRYALKVTDSSDANSVGVQSDLVAIEPGMTYRLGVYAMELNGGSSFQAYIDFGQIDSETGKYVRDTAFYVSTTGTGEWNYCEVTGIAPNASTHARILLVSGGAATGETCYDCVTFTKVGMAEYVPVAFDGQWELINNGYPRMDFDSQGLADIIAFSQSANVSAYGYSGTAALQSLIATADAYLNETEMTLSFQEKRITFQLHDPENPAGSFEDPTCREEFNKSPAGYADGYPYMTSFGDNAFKRVQTLALAYAITGEVKYGERVKQYVLDMCGWEYWVGYHESIEITKEASSQGTGYIVDSVVAAYDLCHDLFTDEELATMETQLIEKGLEAMYQDCMPRMLRGQDMEQGTGLILGACVLLNEDNVDSLKKYLDMGMTYINWRLDQFLNSGVNEGNMYDSLGIDDIMVAMCTLKRVTGYEGPFEHPYIEEMEKRVLGFFDMTSGILPAYSDSEFKSYYRHAMAVLSQQGNDLATYYLAVSGALSSAYDQLVWHTDKSLDELVIPDDRLSNVTYLGAHGQGALRTGWGTLDSLLVINANQSQQEHNHYDQNSIMLAFNGKWMLNDSEYKDNAYTTLTTWELKYTNSTIFVDGKPQISRGKGSLEQVFNTHVYGYMIGSAPDSYGLEDKEAVLNKFDRHVIMLNHDSQPYYIVIDDLDSNKERSFGWNFYTNGKLAIDDEAYTGYWDQVEMDGVVVENGTSATGNRLTLSNYGCALHSYFVGAQVTTRELSYLTHGPTLLVENSTASKNYQFMNVLSVEENTTTQYTTNFADLIGQDGKIELTKASGTSYELGNVASTDLVLFHIDGDAGLNGPGINFKFDVPEDGEYYISVDVAQTMTNHNQWNVLIEGIDNDGDGYADYLSRGNTLMGPEGIFVIDAGKQYLTAGEHTLRILLSGTADADVTLPISALHLRKVGQTMGEGSVKVLESYDAGDLLGAKISYDSALSDIVLFNRGTGTIIGGGLSTNGQQASLLGLSGDDISEGYAVTGGTSLKYGDLVLMTASGPVSVAVDYTMAKTPVAEGVEAHKDFNELDPVIYVSTKADADAVTSIYLGIDVAYTASVDGEAVDASYDKTTGMLTMTVPKGEHQITVSGKHDHVWIDADCVTPKTCKLCGETEGEALGHDWNAATCTTSKYCKVCGVAEGGPKHTGTEGESCIVCGKIFGYCSDNITWTLYGGTLTISGVGEMPNYATAAAVPWSGHKAEITKAIVEDGVTSIGGSAFRNYTELTSISIPASVTSIGLYAFNKCTALTDVVFCGTEDEWAEITVKGSNASLTSATLSYHTWTDGNCTTPRTCTTCGATDGTAQHTVVEEICTVCGVYGTCGDNLSWTLENGTLTISGTGAMNDYGNKEGTYTPWYDSRNTITTIVVENGVTHIGKYAFYNCRYATDVQIGNSVTVLRYASFHQCAALRSVTLGKNVTTIEAHAFSGCSKLTTVNVPVTVEKIANDAFKYCTNIATVNYCGTEEQWNQIEITSTNNDSLINAPRNYHVWKNATCSTPKTCQLCGATEGKVGDEHSYVDGVCADCGAICEHANGNADHICDICGKALGTCHYDNGIVTTAPTCTTAGIKTFTCLLCGDTYTEEVPATGHTAAEAVIENEKTATCVAAGSYDTVVYCSVCNAEISRVTTTVEATGEHNYVDGVCSVCGDKEVVEHEHSYEYVDNGNNTHDKVCSCGDVAIDNELHSYNAEHACACGHTLFEMKSGSSATLEAMLQLDFIINPEQMTGTDNYAILTRTYADGPNKGTVDQIRIDQADWSDYSNNRKAASYTKIAAKEMGDEVTIVLYNAQGQQLSVPKTDSIKGYAYRGLTALANTSNEKNIMLRTTLADMLNYGAAAQVFFKYDAEKLVNAEMTATQQSWATAEEVATSNNADSGLGGRSRTLTLESAIQLDFIFYANVVGAESEWANRYAIATYEDHYGKTKTVRVEGKDFIPYGSTTDVQVSVVGMAVADYQSLVTCVVYNSEGEEVGRSVDSIEGYANRATNAASASETLKDVLKTLMKFGAAADAYF